MFSCFLTALLSARQTLEMIKSLDSHYKLTLLSPTSNTGEIKNISAMEPRKRLRDK